MLCTRLHAASIQTSSLALCSRGRKCKACPNAFRCRDLFTVSDGPVVVRQLRERLWSLTGTVSQRRERLMSLLHSFVVVNNIGKRLFAYDDSVI